VRQSRDGLSGIKKSCQEDKYFMPLAQKYRMIMDLDDRRNKNYGEWYTDSNPLSLDKLKWFVG
jgi:hypothetical protein